MQTFYEIFVQSLAKTDKLKNGDFCDYTVLQEKEQIVVLALADGVGGKPCDYLASATAVGAFLKYFANDIQPDINRRIQNACQYANKQVIQAPNDCKEMLTTFVVIAWVVTDNVLYYTSVGDSRIYIKHQGEMVLITEDDVTEKVKKAGKHTYVQSYLTKVLGTGELYFDVQKQPFLPGDECWLMSDGFYHALQAHTIDLLQLWKYQDFEKGASELFKKHIAHYQDDASVVALRRNDVVKGFTQHYQQWAEQNGFSEVPTILQQPLLSLIIFEEVAQNLQDRKLTKVMEQLTLISTLDIYPVLSSVEHLLQVFGEHKINHREVYGEIRKLLMKAAR